jgi:hypothetical protein
VYSKPVLTKTQTVVEYLARYTKRSKTRDTEAIRT